ncbi:hypothetical protein [Nocardioides bruguierae]|uniref:hypothetical protein n=1 Tax=Nocardioides bruguierae TaxID=2945102 RepID=UPI002020C4C2|nr:hypothetical protein [Nocardioides bruguierae]MCL8025169.1 hypothetical protein [Nocardioides bruguierae]
MSTQTVPDLREPQEPSGGTHPVNVTHLVMSVVLLGLAATWALVQADVVERGDLRWLLPLPWVLAGVAGLLTAVLGGRRRRERAEEAHREAYRHWLEEEDLRHRRQAWEEYQAQQPTQQTAAPDETRPLSVWDHPDEAPPGTTDETTDETGEGR